MNNWTREELLMAYNLYCRISYGQFHKGNPQVIELARIINRTPSAVAMKLGNFASFDQEHHSRGVSGLNNASKLDRAIWEEVTSNWEKFAEESELLLRDRNTSTISLQDDIPSTYSGDATEIVGLTKVRLGQRFFRSMILSAYGVCCVCGIPIHELLVASHIIPWSDREELRLNPHNGLCLCALHDKAFDTGYLTILPNYTIFVSPRIKEYLPQPALDSAFVIYHTKTIIKPNKFPPNAQFLDEHSQRYF